MPLHWSAETAYLEVVRKGQWRSKIGIGVRIDSDSDNELTDRQQLPGGNA
ncbi:MAG: hypothetical protein ACOX52_11715 [Verrucomicrobiota bacterium]